MMISLKQGNYYPKKFCLFLLLLTGLIIKSTNAQQKTTYWDNGNKATEAIYYDDTLNGVYKSWYENGNVKEDLDYKMGKLDGRQLYYFANNLLRGDYNYIDGKENGLQKFWDSIGVSPPKNRTG